MPDFMEEWKPVLGFATGYEVSNQGRIRFKGREVKCHIGDRGYVKATLRGNPESRRRSVRVHRLVAEAFVGRCPDGQQVNHIDGKKTNNCASNLEYVTPSQNMHHAWRTGLVKSRDAEYRKSRQLRLALPPPPKKLTAEKVRLIRSLAEQHSARRIAPMFNLHHETVCRILRKETWGHVN